VTVDFNYKLLA